MILSEYEKKIEIYTFDEAKYNIVKDHRSGNVTKSRNVCVSEILWSLYVM